jgi:heme-degrading monooxygenase HmoA
MYIRLTRFTSSTPIDDKRVADGGARLNATFGQMTGYLGWAALLDRASGKAASVTYWADAESMRASEEAGNAVRARLVSEGGEIIGIQRMERLIQESVGTPQSGSFARVTTLALPPERIDEMIADTKKVSVAPVKAQPGFRSFLVSADRETGRVSVASVWESDAAREASRAPMANERQHTMERFGATVESVEAYEIVGVEVRLPAPAS